MAKTYNTIPSVATGDLLTATAWNNQATNVNNYRVPPAVRVTRSTSNQSITLPSYVQWNNAAASFDTDGMWSSGANTRLTINTAGLYLVTWNYFIGWTGNTATVEGAISRTTSGGSETDEGYLYVYQATGVFQYQMIGVISVLCNASVGDYFRARVVNAGATSPYVGFGNVSSFSATWLGQAS